MGGQAPDPTGVLHGSVLYAGPRPECLRRDDGSACAVPGRVALLMFRFDNPPPPSGSATSAENFLVIPGDQLFSLEDCMPVSPTPADLMPISRSVGFAWPTVRLGRSYQIRGFCDNDGDFSPFFSVRNLATYTPPSAEGPQPRLHASRYAPRSSLSRSLSLPRGCRVAARGLA